MHLDPSKLAGLSASYYSIPGGKEGVITTLKFMRRLVIDYKAALPIRVQAANLVKPCKQKDWSCEVKNLHAFVRDKIRFVRDVRDIETLYTPDKTLERKEGDCDDKAVLLAAMLESIGHPSRFVAVGFAPEEYEHVFVETKIGPRWIPLETTEPVNVGWIPQGIVSRLVIYN
jgi:hypothetical protein